MRRINDVNPRNGNATSLANSQPPFPLPYLPHSVFLFYRFHVSPIPPLPFARSSTPPRPDPSTTYDLHDPTHDRTPDPLPLYPLCRLPPSFVLTLKSAPTFESSSPSVSFQRFAPTFSSHPPFLSSITPPLLLISPPYLAPSPRSATVAKVIFPKNSSAPFSLTAYYYYYYY